MRDARELAQRARQEALVTAGPNLGDALSPRGGVVMNEGAAAWLAELRARIEDLPELIELGRYQLVYGLGRGSHGVVYEGFDHHLERHVAIKVFTGWSSFEDIEREAFGLARVEHPNVVTVHDLCIESGLVLLVMELVHGGTIRQRARSCDDWREIVGWFVQAARGLQAVHDVGLVHGDVKPSNIIVDHEGRVRLIDFSLCCGLGERARGGTRRYLPPERVEGDRVDPRGDQYSLAASIVDSLSGRPALEAPRLSKVLRRAMAKEPADRFDGVGGLADELEEARASLSAGGIARGWLSLFNRRTRDVRA